MSPLPVAPNLFITEPELRLLGGRERDGGKLVFPLPDDEAYVAVELPPRGILWSFTMQRFAPKAPPYCGAETFEPFAVGYVELPGALIVEGRLTDVAFASLHIGMPMELTTVNLGDARVGVRQSYAFRPTPGAVAAP